MDNTEKLLNDLAALQQSIIDAQNKAEELQKQIEAQSKKSLLERVEAGSGDVYWGINEFNIFTPRPATSRCKTYYKGSAFTTQEQAANYRKAFEIFLELRRCEGSESAIDDKEQYYIQQDDEGNIYIDAWINTHNKTRFISPMFSAVEFAEKAIDTLGKENIIHMFNTFHGLV